MSKTGAPFVMITQEVYATNQRNGGKKLRQVNFFVAFRDKDHKWSFPYENRGPFLFNTRKLIPSLKFLKEISNALPGGFTYVKTFELADPGIMPEVLTDRKPPRGAYDWNLAVYVVFRVGKKYECVNLRQGIESHVYRLRDALTRNPFIDYIVVCRRTKDLPWVDHNGNDFIDSRDHVVIYPIIPATLNTVLKEGFKREQRACRRDYRQLITAQSLLNILPR